MHIIFSTEEMKWIDIRPFNWTVKSKCPEAIKKSIEKKLRILNENMGGGL